jgi:hypothetical protein
MTTPVDPLSERGNLGLGLSRRSLIAAGAIVATVASTSMARAFSSSRKPHHGLGGGSPGTGPAPGGRPGTEPRSEHGGGEPGSTPETHCFCRGTRLLTPLGEVAIEDLSIGDVVVTHAGAERAIRWIGTFSFARDHADWPEQAMPVRIAKDAFAPGVPRRDLYVSREHLLLFNGVLIPAGDLINGATIRAVAPAGDVIDYLHVELDAHDVLIAEGAPCESLLANAERRASFDNMSEFAALYGSGNSGAVPCAPISAFNGRRSALRSRLRSALTPIVDIRHPMDVVRDNVEARAAMLKAA